MKYSRSTRVQTAANTGTNLFHIYTQLIETCQCKTKESGMLRHRPTPEKNTAVVKLEVTASPEK